MKTLNQLAREHLLSAGNDRQVAVSRAVEELIDNKPLLQSVLSQVLNEAVSQIVHRQITEQRTNAIVSATSGVVARQAERGRQLAKTLMDFPLLSGVSLSRATKPVVVETAQYYIDQGNINLHRGRWLMMVASRLPNNRKSVGTTLTVDELNDLYIEAEQETE